MLVLVLVNGLMIYEFPYATNFSGIWAEEWYMKFHIPLILVLFGTFYSTQSGVTNLSDQFVRKVGPATILKKKSGN